MRDAVHIVGRFPPPIDGQTLATERLASLLEEANQVRRLNTGPSDQALIPARTRGMLQRTRHYVRQRPHLRRLLADAPQAPVLWCSISPGVAGHFRDVTTVVPCFAARQPVAAVVHRGNFDRVFRQSATALTARLLSKRISQFVFLASSLAAPVKRWVPAQKIAVIPNTIDAACSAADVGRKQAARGHRKDLRLLYMSNMMPSKGYLDILEALGRVQGLALTATFGGRWNSEADRRAFASRVRALGMEKAVVHHGSISDRSRVMALHLDADVLLLPSYYREEAQPLAIIEALSAGTPVIVTRQGAIEEMVRQNQEAIFVPARSPESIAMAIKRFSDLDTWMRASRCARDRFERHFSAPAVGAKWNQMLRDLRGAA